MEESYSSLRNPILFRSLNKKKTKKKHYYYYYYWIRLNGFIILDSSELAKKYPNS
jgi:hypothetical protein